MNTKSTTTATTSGMTETENAVKFINNEVLNPSVTPIKGTAKPMVDQAAAMMVQDAQSFLHGNEQILTVALAKAAGMATNEDPVIAAIGVTAMASITTTLETLPTFSTAVGASAATIISGFESSSSSGS